MVMSLNQNKRQNHNIKTNNKSSERVEQFKYLGTTLNESKFHSGRNEEQTEVRECLLSFSAESLSSSLLTKNTKIKIYKL